MIVAGRWQAETAASRRSSAREWWGTKYSSRVAMGKAEAENESFASLAMATLEDAALDTNLWPIHVRIDEPGCCGHLFTFTFFAFLKGR